MGFEAVRTTNRGAEDPGCWNAKSLHHWVAVLDRLKKVVCSNLFGPEHEKQHLPVPTIVSESH
jgi:hypothetical protein